MNEKTNSLALASFIVGLLSIALLTLGVIPGIVAIVLGIIALREKENRKQDKVFSIIGIVTGILPVLIVFLLIISMMFFTGVENTGIENIGYTSSLIEVIIE